MGNNNYNRSLKSLQTIFEWHYNYLSTICCLFFFSKATLEVEQGVFNDLHLMSMEAWTAEQGEAKLKQKNRHIPVRSSTVCLS